MKTIQKTYRYAILPDEDQKTLLAKHFGCVRWVFNHFLNERKEQYLLGGKSDNYYKQAATLTQLKKGEETEWLKEVNSQTLQYSLRCLDTAYLNFFRAKAKFPRFKSRRDKNSFTIPQFVTVEDCTLHIPKFKEGIKINLHRPLEGEIKHCTISKNTTGKYFVSILCEVEYEPFTKTGNECGIDLGLKHLVITSDGEKFKNNKYTKKYEKQLRLAQKHLAHKDKGSNRYENQRLKVALLHEKIANSRMDNLQKVSTELIKEYDLIALEDLNVKGMNAKCKPKQDETGRYLPNGQAAKSGLNRSISDASWGNFVRILTYKAEWNDKEIIRIGRFFPSSKLCSCGWINQNLKLSDRIWTCSYCGTTHDRDILAANNILKEGKRIKSAGTVDHTRRAKIRPDFQAQAMKREAHQSSVDG